MPNQRFGLTVRIRFTPAGLGSALAQLRSQHGEDGPDGTINPSFGWRLTLLSANRVYRVAGEVT